MHLDCSGIGDGNRIVRIARIEEARVPVARVSLQDELHPKNGIGLDRVGSCANGWSVDCGKGCGRPLPWFYIPRLFCARIATGFSGLRLDCVGITDCVGLFDCVPGHAVGFEFGLL